MSYAVRTTILVFFALLLAGSVALIPTLKFAFSFETFYPENDPDFEFYKAYKEKFRTDKQSIMVHFFQEEGVIHPEFLNQVRKFTLKCRRLPKVSEATSIPVIKDVIYDPAGPLQVPLIDLKDPRKFTRDSIRLRKDPRMLNTFLSESGKTLAVMVITDSSMTLVDKRDLLQQIDSLVIAFGFETPKIVGAPVGDVVVMGTQEKEFKFYIMVATLVILISMILLFRRPAGVLVSFVSVITGMVIFFGFFALMGQELDILSSIYPILLVIVGTSDVVHLMTKYVEELRQGKERQAALRISVKEIGLATLMTSVTTAVGFMSLYSSKLPPIREFGLLSAFGVFVAYLTVMLFTTALMSFFSADQLIRPGKGAERFRDLMLRLNLFTRLRSRGIAIGSLLVLGIAGYGMNQINTNVFDTRDIPYDAQLKKDFDFVNDEMNGVSAVEMALEPGSGHSLEEWEVMKEVDKLDKYLAAQPEMSAPYSPLVLFKNANRAWNYNNPEYYTLPESQHEFQEQLAVIRDKWDNKLRSMITSDGQTGRFAIKIKNIGTDATTRLNEANMEWIQKNINQDLLKVTLTGSKYLFDKNQILLVESLFTSLGLAFLIVSIFMAIVFQNARMILISLIPNVIPLLLAGAVVGFLGFGLDAKVAVVFTIAFGIAVDDTIHFLAKFKLERTKGKNVEEALEKTFTESGKAICITSIILFFGFATLGFSVFPPTEVMGVLLAFTMAAALVSDLLLTPVLIRWLIRK